MVTVTRGPRPLCASLHLGAGKKTSRLLLLHTPSSCFRHNSEEVKRYQRLAHRTASLARLLTLTDILPTSAPNDMDIESVEALLESGKAAAAAAAKAEEGKGDEVG